MKISIIPLYKGKKAIIYTINIDDRELNEYEEFVFSNKNQVPDAVRTLNAQLKNIACKSGIIDEQFIRESPPTHNVFRISETEDFLRLYCIKYSRVAIVVGGGGIKNEKKVKLQENPELQKVCDLLMEIEDFINYKILSKEIYWTDNELVGDLTFELPIGKK